MRLKQARDRRKFAYRSKLKFLALGTTDRPFLLYLQCLMKLTPPRFPHAFASMPYLYRWHTIFKDHITLEDYEIHDGMGLELYYN